MEQRSVAKRIALVAAATLIIACGGKVGGGAHAAPPVSAHESSPRECAAAMHGPPLVRIQDASGGAYCMDRTEVTSGQYKEFLTSVRFSPPPDQDPSCSWNIELDAGFLDANPNGAATSVDWCDAVAFCKWAGKHLCGRLGGGSTPIGAFNDYTASEWYNACSATGRRIYPYGNTYDADACNGEIRSGVLPVAVKPKCTIGPDGPYDLSGNVWEWEDSCFGQTGAHDACRLRGGSRDADAKKLRCDADYGVERSEYFGSVGFRCCAPASR